MDVKPQARIEVLELNENGAYATAMVATDTGDLKVADPFDISLVPARLLDV